MVDVFGIVGDVLNNPFEGIDWRMAGFFLVMIGAAYFFSERRK